MEQFRRMVAEMEGEVQEKTHALAKKMKEEKEREVKEDNESLEDVSCSKATTSFIIHSLLSYFKLQMNTKLYHVQVASNIQFGLKAF